MNYNVKTTIPLMAGSALTATANSALCVLPNSEGIVEALINVSAATGTSPTLTPTLQVSNDGVTWYNAVVGAVMNGVGSQRLQCVSLAAYARISYTVGGTTPSLTTSITILAN